MSLGDATMNDLSHPMAFVTRFSIELSISIGKTTYAVTLYFMVASTSARVDRQGLHQTHVRLVYIVLVVGLGPLHMIHS